MKKPGPTMLYWLRRCVVALWLLLAPGLALSGAPSEYDVKLVYLFNFTKFVNWPETSFKAPDSPLFICILGDLPNANSIAELAGKKSRNHEIIIKTLSVGADHEQCHILFLTKSLDFATTKKVMENLKSPTLVVGETSGFAKHEGVIGFITDDRRRVRIEINLDNAKSQNLTIRAQLLEIARRVYRDQENT